MILSAIELIRASPPFPKLSEIISYISDKSTIRYGFDRRGSKHAVRGKSSYSGAGSFEDVAVQAVYPCTGAEYRRILTLAIVLDNVRLLRIAW